MSNYSAEVKINEIWTCALNYTGCIAIHKNGKKESLSLDAIKHLLQSYREWVRENSYSVASSRYVVIDDTLSLFFESIGLVEIQFI